MSNKIDQQVVEMRFDSRQFEQNVSSTMSAVEKLKQSLNFKGVSKGFDNVSAAANSVDMSGMAKGIETVRMKFSALEVMGVTALANITNQAVNAGKRLASSLSVDQITSGWSKYEQKTASVQTIMNSTGKSIDEVNGYLSKLMWFSDETSYGFTDMTAALGQMTSSGGDIEKLIPLITGVANATAYAGKGASEFSRVMYNLNQSYGAGYLQLMDWKSLELAGVGSKQLKQTIIDVGVELGKIQKGQVTVANFSETLKDKWADTKVMEEAFGRFGEFSDAVYKLSQDIESGNLSAYPKEIQEMAKNGELETASQMIDALADNYSELGTKAFRSAQEAKSFTEAIDATKDAVSSGWMKTFELIFGNYEQAKVLWTDLANSLWDVFASGGDSRNAWLEEVLSYSPLEKFSEKLKQLTATIEAPVKKLEEYNNIVNRIIRGDYGNGQSRFDKLAEEGYDWARAQNLVNEKLGNSYRYATKLTDAKSDLQEATKELTDAQLKEIGFTDDEISLYRDLEKQAEDTGVSVSELVNNMGEMDARTVLLNGFKNVGSGLLGIFQALKEAWSDIFPPMSALRVYNIITAFEKLTSSLRLTDKETGELNENGEKLKRTFKGLFAAVDIVFTLLSGPAKIAFKLITKLLGIAGITILDVTAAVGDAVVGFRDWIDSILNFNGLFEWIAPYIQKATDAVKEWIEATKPLEKVATFFEKVSDAVRDFAKACWDADITQNIVDGLTNGLKSAGRAVWDAMINLGKTILNAIKNVLGIHSPSTEFFEIGRNIIAGLINGLESGIKAVIDCLGALGERMVTAFKGVDLSKVSSLFTNIVKLFPQLKILTKMSGLFGIFKDLGLNVTDGFSGGIAEGATSIFGAIASLANRVIEIVKNILGIHSPSAVFASLGKFAIAGLVIGIIGASYSELFPMLKTIFGKLVEFCKGLFSSISQSAQNLDFSNFQIKWEYILGIGALIGVAILFKKVLSIFDSFGNGIEALGTGVKKIGGFFETLDKKLKGTLEKKTKTEQFADSMLKFAISVGILAASVALLSKVAKTGGLWEAIGAIGTLAAIMLVMSLVASKIQTNGGDFGKLALMVVGISTALFIMASAIKKLEFLNKDNVGYVLGGLAAMVVGLGGIIAAFGIFVKGKTAQNVGKAAITLLAISYAMLIMVKVMKQAGDLDPDAIHKGVAIILAFGGIITGLVALTKLAGKKIDQVGRTLTKMALSMLLMVAVIKLTSGMNENELIKGMAVISTFALLMALFVRSIGPYQKDLTKVGTTLLAMSVAMLLLVGVVRLISGMSAEELIKGIAVISIFALLMALFIKSVAPYEKDLAKVGTTLLGMSVVLAIMATIAVVLSMISIEGLKKGVTAVGLLSLMMMGMMWAAKGVGDIKGTMIGLAVAIGVMAASVAALSFIDPTKLTNATMALTLLMGMFALIVKMANGMQASMGPLIVMVSAIGVIAGALYLVAQLPVENAISSAISLSVLMLALSGAMAILKIIGSSIKDALSGVLALTTMAIPLLAFVGVLAVMQNIQNAEKNVMCLVAMATAMTILLAVLSLIGVIIGASGGMALLGVAGLTLMAAPLIAFVGVLAVMQNIQNAEANVNLLITLMTTMTSMLTTISILSPLIALGTVAIIGMTYTVGLLGALIVAAGALAQIPGLKWLIGEGTEILGKIGYALGNFVGSVIGGIGAGISSGLPTIAENLTKFMSGIGGFIEGAKSIDQTIIDKVKTLAEAIAIITEASVLEKIQNGNANGSALVGFSEILTGFAAGFIEFSNQLSGLDESTVNKTALVADAMKKLVEMAADIPNSGGMVSWFTGDNDLVTFGQKLKSFALEFVDYSKNLSGIDGSIVQNTTLLYDSLKMLNEISNNIPNSGGMVSWFTGENDIVGFGQKIKAFALDFKEYANNISGIDESVVRNTTLLYESLSKLNDIVNNIPNSGGMVSWFTGDNDLVTFGQKIRAFGWDFKEYSKNIADLDGGVVGKTELIYQSMQKLTAIASEIPKEGGIFSVFSGDQDFGTFGSKLTYFGWCIGEYCRNIANFDGAKVNSATHELWEISHLVNHIKDVDTSGLTPFVKGIKNMGKSLNEYSNSVGSIDGGRINSITHELWELSNFTEHLKDVGSDGLSGFTTALNDLANVSIDKLITSFNDAKGRIGEAVYALFNSFAYAVNNSSVDLSTSFVVPIDSVLTTISGKQPSFAFAGQTLVTSFNSGVDTQNTNITSTFATAITATLNELLLKYEDFKNIGKYMVEGIVEGIKNNTYKLTNQIKIMAKNAVKAAQKELDINSPSVVFSDEVGRYIVQGVADGIKKDMSAEEAAEKKAQNIKSAFQTEFDMLDALDTDLDLRIKLGWATDDGSSFERQKERVKLAKSEWEETIKYSNDALLIREAHNNYLREELDLLDMINDKTSENFKYNMSWIEERGKDNKASLEEQLRYWKRISAMYIEGSLPYETAMKKVKELQETLDGSMTYNEELNEYLYLMTQCEEGTEDWAIAAEKVAGAMKKIYESPYENSLNWIEEQKENSSEFSLFDELAAWKRVQNKWTGIDDEKAEEAGDNVKRVLQELTDAHESYAKEVESINADMNEELAELDEDYQKQCEDRNKQLADDIDALNEKYEEALESRRKSIYGAYGLFDKAKPNKYVSGQALIENLQSQVDQLDIWRNDLNSLASRGIDNELIEELRELGPSSAAQIEALNKLSDEELNQYVTLWRSKHELAKEQATFELENMRVETEEQIALLTAEAESDLEEYKRVWVESTQEIKDKTTEKLEELKEKWLREIGVIKTETTTEFTELTNSLVEIVGDTTQWTTAGVNILEGVIAGVASKTTELNAKMNEIAHNALDSFKATLDMHSPSREFMKLGRYIDEGLIVGVDSLKNKVSKSSEGLGLATIDSLSNTIAKINDLVAENIDIQPTIRPVLDLTNVREGFRGIDSMFARNQAMAISSYMNRDSSENQNGDSDKSSGNTYTFTQNNYSPKALSRLDIYRQTKNQFSAMKGLVEP